jgi:hypothetical protein
MSVSESGRYDFNRKPSFGANIATTRDSAAVLTRHAHAASQFGSEPAGTAKPLDFLCRGPKPTTSRHRQKISHSLPLQQPAACQSDACLDGNARHAFGAANKGGAALLKTGSQGAVQLLLGHTKLESTVRYLGRSAPISRREME